MICKTRYKFNKPVATFKVRGKLCKYTAGTATCKVHAQFCSSLHWSSLHSGSSFEVHGM